MSQDQKQDAIIEAALKRFAHFGVSKTTMTEIAGDLSISKALLYYYFPDKLSLFIAVFNRITSESTRSSFPLIDNEPDPFRAIVLFLELRTQFIIKYHNILEHLKSYHSGNFPTGLSPLFTRLKQNELKRIEGILERGREQNLFTFTETPVIAELFYDFLEGFRQLLYEKNNRFFPDKQQFTNILQKEKQFARIFFNGLTLKN